MKQAIINFLSSRLNLTILQLMCYFVIGYIMGEHLTWSKMAIMFIVMFLIQFITRTKAVADGMVIREIMMDLNIKANDVVQKMKEDTKKMNKKDLN